MAAHPVALIIGASRGLGLGLAREYTHRGWHVVATVRDKNRPSALHELQQQAGEALQIETLDMVDAGQIAQLRKRLEARRFDLLFVNAGVANDPAEKIGEVSDEEFMRVMVTNALSPLRVIEQLIELVTPAGQVAVMSSGLGSVANNTEGGWELYRASKAALNTLMRSLAARHGGETRGFFAIAPGWVRTDMGGAGAALDVETSIAGVADTLQQRAGSRGLVFVNYLNEILPW